MGYGHYIVIFIKPQNHCDPSEQAVLWLNSHSYLKLILKKKSALRINTMDYYECVNRFNSKFKNIILFSFTMLILIILFYFHLIFSTSEYIGWGNFYPPITKGQLVGGAFYIFWKPLGGDGSLNPFPSTTMINIVFSTLPITITKSVLPLWLFIRLYIVFTTLFLAASFYLLSNRFSENFFARLFAVIFFIFNAFEVDQLSAGDFLQFVSLGFLLLSLNFVILSRQRKNPYNFQLLISIIFLFLSLGNLQFTYLGAFLYLLFCIIFTPNIINALKDKNKLIKEILLPFFINLLFIFLIFLPFILPAAFGSYISLGPNSSYAQPLSEFSFFSNNFFSVLFLTPYPILNVSELSVSTYPALVVFFWNICLILSLSIALVWGFLKKDGRLIVFSTLIFLASIIGSGPKSVLPFIPIFLYEHLYGYQLLNASYYWDWIIISPLYSIIFIYIFQDIFCKIRNRGVKIKKISYRRLNKSFFLLFSIILVFVLIMPIASQGYYNQNGVINRGEYIPPYFVNLSQQIQKLTNCNYDGVAFFPPTNELYLSGGSPHFNNPLMSNVPFRLPPSESYGSLPSPTSSYFSNVYNVFYSNETTHLQELMGIGGFYYFVVLKDVKAYGYNANGTINEESVQNIMNYQAGIKMIYNSSEFAIYESSFKRSVAYTPSNPSILLGNFYALNSLANEGVNILNFTMFEPSDINSNNWKCVLGYSQNIILQNYSDINSLFLASTNYSVISIKNYVTQIYNNSYPPISWVYGPNYYVPEISNTPTSPNNFVFTESNSSIVLPITNSNGKNIIFLKVWFSGYSNVLKLYANGKLIQVINASQKNFSGFRLVQINNSFNSSSLLSIKSSLSNKNQINAVGNLYITNQSQLINNKEWINNFINSRKINLLKISQPQNFKINASVVNISFKPTYGGFSLYLFSSTPVIVNYPYYGNENVNGKILTAFGGLNMFIIPSNNSLKINLTYNSYILWSYSSYIQLLSIFVLGTNKFYLKIFKRLKKP